MDKKPTPEEEKQIQKEATANFREMVRNHFSLKRLPKQFKAPAIVILLILLTAIPLTTTLVNQRQDVRQRAAGEVIDTLSYFLPTDTTKSWNGATWEMTTDNKLYNELSGRNIQIFKWDSNYIYFLEDRPNTAFTDGRWMKRQMQVGESFAVTDTITNFDQVNTCVPLQTLTFPHTQTLDQHIPNYPAGGDLGTVDAIVLKYDYVTRYELFFYAKNHGFFYWEKHNPDGTLYQKSIVYNTINPNPVYADCSRACTTSLQTCALIPPTTGSPTITTNPSTTITQPASTVTQPPTSTIGYIAASCASGIGGWACDPSAPSQPLNVQFYVDGDQLRSTFLSLHQRFSY